MKSLTGLWVLLWVAVSFIFFAVTRFRMPVVACLIPWAGVGLSSLGQLRSRLPATRRIVQASSALGIVAIAALVIPSISLGDTWLGIERWGQQAPYRQAETLLQQGKPVEAEAQYRLANAEITDTRYGLASTLLQEGKPQDALAVLAANEPDDRFEPLVIKGEAARLTGDNSTARLAVQRSGGASCRSRRARLGMGPPEPSSHKHLADWQRARHGLHTWFLWSRDGVRRYTIPVVERHRRDTLVRRADGHHLRVERLAAPGYIAGYHQSHPGAISSSDKAVRQH